MPGRLPELVHTQLAVICPSHFCDRVETLEEIEIRGLNDSEAGIQCLEELMKSSNHWPTV